MGCIPRHPLPGPPLRHPYYSWDSQTHLRARHLQMKSMGAGFANESQWPKPTKKLSSLFYDRCGNITMANTQSHNSSPLCVTTNTRTAACNHRQATKPERDLFSVLISDPIQSASLWFQSGGMKGSMNHTSIPWLKLASIVLVCSIRLMLVIFC